MSVHDPTSHKSASAEPASPEPTSLDPTSSSDLQSLHLAVTACQRCPRLVEWRTRTAREKRASFRDQEYWGKPVPGFGDPDARVLIVGLAPAAHGANRTGRMFTGDRSGDWLYRALHRSGFANQARSEARGDGLVLRGAYVTAAVRCAPPANKPSTAERDHCRPFLLRELELLAHVRVVVALGGFGWTQILRSLGEQGHDVAKPRPKFGHLAEATVGPYTVLGSYHPSQQNTFTGRLTEPMFDRVWARATELTVP